MARGRALPGARPAPGVEAKMSHRLGVAISAKPAEMRDRRARGSGWGNGGRSVSGTSQRFPGRGPLGLVWRMISNTGLWLYENRKGTAGMLMLGPDMGHMTTCGGTGYNNTTRRFNADKQQRIRRFPSRRCCPRDKRFAYLCVVRCRKAGSRKKNMVIPTPRAL